MRVEFEKNATLRKTTIRSLTLLPDDHSKREPPDPIPNSEVKPFSADGSVGIPHVRVGHRQAFYFTVCLYTNFFLRLLYAAFFFA